MAINASSFIFSDTFELTLPLGESRFWEEIGAAFSESEQIVDFDLYENGFGLTHKNILPKLYGFSPVYFRGEVLHQDAVSTRIKVKAVYFRIVTFTLCLMIIALPAVFLMNIDDVQDKWPYDLLLLNPIVWPITIYSLGFLYYRFKSHDVKSFLIRYSDFWKKNRA